MQPLHRWVGGKRRLAYIVRALLPPCKGKYFEPFLGGGAILWQRLAAGEVTTAVGSDANPHLVNLWEQVASWPAQLHAELQRLPRTTSRYRDIQALLNSSKPTSPEAAAWTLWLIAAGFNGLWRVNANGHHNVPPGDSQAVRLPALPELQARAELLRKTVFANCDFELALDRAMPGDQVYADPPYLPSATAAAADFNDYTAGGFGIAEHQRLVKVLARLGRQGVHCVASGRLTPASVELYRGSGAQLVGITHRHSVAASGEGRVQVGEFLAVWR